MKTLYLITSLTFCFFTLMINTFAIHSNESCSHGINPKLEELDSRIANFDSLKKLVIDQEIEWGTYYGGSGTEGLNSVTTDAIGNVYACGTTYGSDGLASGGFQNSNPALNGGIAAAFLVKFNSEGDRVWATYYSGGSFTGAISVAVDSEGNVYMTGFTSDLGLSSNGYQNLKKGISDAYLVKFNSAGERLWATYFGGSEDEVARTVAVDGQDNVYITGRTFSADFPTLNAYQDSPGENVSLFGDAFLAKFDPSGDLLWSTYYGGAQGEFAFFATCDGQDNVYITGNTSSESGIFLGGHQAEYGGSQDAFIAKYDSNGILLWSTYYGGSGEDIAYGCATDNLGNVFISGETGSLENIAFNGFQETYAAAFLAKFNAIGELEWGTYYGTGNSGPGSGANVGYACETDLENNVYLAGGTNSTNGISSQGFQNTYGGGFSDAYVVQFAPSGERIWGSYNGGAKNDYARALHVDKASTIYLAGTTQSSNGIFFDGFQDTQENETSFTTKITTCPSPMILNLPNELCAGSTLLLEPFPAGGTLELIGEGEISQTSFFAPEVNEITNVTIRYTTLGNIQCLSTINDFELVILPNLIATVEISTDATELCKNDNITIVADIENVGSNPIVEWFLNEQLVQEGNLEYNTSTLVDNDVISVEVQNSNACSTPSEIASNSLAFKVNPIPEVSLVFTDLQGGTLVSDFGFTSYQWFLDGDLIQGETSSTLIPIANGTYTVTVTNEFGCANSASTTVLTVSTTEELEELVSLYPNPTDGRLILDFGLQAPQRYTISNSIGEIVYLNSQPAAKEQLDLGNVTPGLYAITFYLNGSMWVEKIVVY